jgi:hypothetical protein
MWDFRSTRARGHTGCHAGAGKDIGDGGLQFLHGKHHDMDVLRGATSIRSRMLALLARLDMRGDLQGSSANSTLQA